MYYLLFSIKYLLYAWDGQSYSHKNVRRTYTYEYFRLYQCIGKMFRCVYIVYIYLLVARYLLDIFEVLLLLSYLLKEV